AADDLAIAGNQYPNPVVLAQSAGQGGGHVTQAADLHQIGDLGGDEKNIVCSVSWRRRHRLNMQLRLRLCFDAFERLSRQDRRSISHTILQTRYLLSVMRDGGLQPLRIPTLCFPSLNSVTGGSRRSFDFFVRSAQRQGELCCGLRRSKSA